METKTFVVPGMSCGHCTSAVESEVGAIGGVATVAADLDTKVVTVAGEALDEAAIRAAIADAGYEAE